MSKKLESEVWNVERCAGCGACVVACSKCIVKFEGDKEHPSRKDIWKNVGLTKSKLDVCHFCEMEGVKFCELSCPRLVEEWPDGPVLRNVLVRTAGKKKTNNPNEIITNLLAGAMQARMIDGAVISDIDRWTLIPYPLVATSISELVESAGNQYIWSPTLQGLKEAIYKMGLKKVAVVGTPCVMQALDRIEKADAKALKHIAERIKLKVGVFCSGVYTQAALEEISESLKIPISSLQSISVSQKDDSLSVATYSGEKKEMKLSEATKLIRAGCGRCYDLLSEASDISIGPIGAGEGHSVAILRTSAGANALDNAANLKLLETKHGVDEKALKTAKEAKKKRKRAEMIDGLKILMLEALRDPARIEEARKKFTEIYYQKTTNERKEKEPEGRYGCGTCSLC
ncbi:MAG: Coenzyme F420 hydrogenase/dehydrogenase, beta subunit C-terminal domain [Thermoplasmata archaeon]|nr:MAG: Coenzyme F420 hydrogenase/dehydrogenase, beta subunit C-terminal domain [Thermoplasmata archaeon]